MNVKKAPGILLVGISLASLAGPNTCAGDEPDTAAIDFFERKIRPALVAHCLECHAADTEVSGGLRLDAKAAWEQGGDSGPSIIPGDAADSLLFKAISYADPNLQMPPDGKLDESVIADFKEWISAGAADPRVTDSNAPARQVGLPVERAQEHWAYRPIPAEIPTQGIDAWIAQSLVEAGIPAKDIAGPASPAIVARRLYFDLTGLPPTPAQLADFMEQSEQNAEGAYQRLVDELLASTHFGETFARRWMDVVRYADSITLRGFVLPEAWRYRDYLIQAFAEDRPFARMIEEQIAGDMLAKSTTDPQTQATQLVATGFWALGNNNLEQQDKQQLEMDTIDEQLDVMGSAFLGQTIGCARCHDHKFDPIPTKDYYALAGILRSAVAFKHDNVSSWIDAELPLPPAEQARFDELQSQLGHAENRIAKLKKLLGGKDGNQKRKIALDELEGIVIDSADARLVGTWATSDFATPLVGTSYLHDEGTGKGSKTATFEPELLPPGEYRLRFAYTIGSNRTRRLPVKIFSAAGESTVYVDQQRAPSEDGVWITLGNFRFEEQGQAYVLISNADTQGHVIVDAVQFLPLDRADQTPDDKKDTKNDSSKTSPHKPDLQAELEQLESLKKRLQAELAMRPRYLTILEQNPPRDIPIHVRGDVHNLGATVPRGFLTALPNAGQALPSDVGGRLELARWIASPENPLTARVYANRVWSWLMGQGLVPTINNFGTTGSPPSHPELLDELARRLIECNWSTKTLVRDIVLSKAYRRAIRETPDSVANIDPDNRLYWRGSARRLTVESLRDAMLQVSGELDLTRGQSLVASGTKADYNYAHRSTRRSIYHPVFRNALPELYEAFDFANSSVSVGRRSRSTVAPQALTLLNHPWVIARAEHTATRIVQESPELASEAIVEQLYLACFARLPTSAERMACVTFLDTGGSNPKTERITHLVQSLFASLDFCYLD
ncbi:MAG: DUF1553 domain-containing protein [Pirellulaceae bacterium]